MLIGFRTMTALFMASVLWACSLVSPDRASAKEPPACSGTDIVAELESANDPLLKRAIERSKAFKNDGHLLWRIQKADGPVSYLYGTIHLTAPAVTKLSPALQQALKAVDQVAVEIRSDTAQSAMASLMGQRPGLFFFTGGQESLAAHLSDEQLDTAGVAAGQPKAVLKQMRPWLLSLMLALAPCERNRIAAKIPVLDEVIERQARAGGKSVISLETVESQVSAMASIPVSDQAELLKVDLANYQRAEDFATTLVRLYREQRIGLVWTLNLEFAARAGVPAERYNSFRNALLDKRNATMLERGRELVDAAPTLIAVGALHLIGDDGLVALFRRAGYTVTPVTQP